MTRLEQLATLSHDELVARLAAAEAPRKAGEITLKASPKGCVQIGGVGRFPLSPYPDQLVRILVKATGLPIAGLCDMPIVAFMRDNNHLLSVKQDIPELGLIENVIAAAEAE